MGVPRCCVRIFCWLIGEFGYLQQRRPKASSDGDDYDDFDDNDDDSDDFDDSWEIVSCNLFISYCQ